MNEFFTSKHCLSKVHCNRCRQLIDGRSFRHSLRLSFSDIAQDDFPCPQGLPWEKILSAGEIDDLYEVVRTEILLAPPEGLWNDLKEEQRLLDGFLELHSAKTPCWKRRQKERLISFAKTVKAKMVTHG